MPNPTPRERAASLRAGADALAEAQDALRRAKAHFADGGWTEIGGFLDGATRAIGRTADYGRDEAQRLERDA